MNSLQLLTKIRGRINGVEFAAEEMAVADAQGESRGVLKFDVEIPNFTPMLCKTWRCKNCSATAKPAFVGANPLAEFLDNGGRITELTVAEYPFSGDTIVLSSLCERPEPGIQVVYQTRVGSYKGPVDIVKQLPFDVHLSPNGSGRATGISVRQVVRANGETLSIGYRDELFFTGGYELPEPLIVRISGDASYSREDLTFTQTVRAALLRTPSLKPAHVPSSNDAARHLPSIP